MTFNLFQGRKDKREEAPQEGPVPEAAVTPSPRGSTEGADAGANPFLLGPAHPLGSLQGLWFNVPKVQDKGEDADPVAAWQGNRGILAVFDGMGGAGSTTYHRNGMPCTGAYVAARVAAEEVRRLISPSFPLPPVPLSEFEIKERLERALQHEALTLESGSEPSRLKSKLIRRLPTTMAALFCEHRRPEDRALTCQSLWAGDSRGYALSPDEGLQQLTVDDLKAGGDALENLRVDSPLSNCLNADGEFKVNSQVRELGLPIVLLTATDGCFGYLFSPAHFEFLLLDCLMATANPVQWGGAIESRLKTQAGDDCSLALLALGWPSFTALQQGFQMRHQLLRDEYILPLDSLTHHVEEAVTTIREAETRKLVAEQRREALRQDLWLRYKGTHDGLLPWEPPRAPSTPVSSSAREPVKASRTEAAPDESSAPPFGPSFCSPSGGGREVIP